MRWLHAMGAPTWSRILNHLSKYGSLDLMVPRSVSSTVRNLVSHAVTLGPVITKKLLIMRLSATLSLLCYGTTEVSGGFRIVTGDHDDYRRRRAAASWRHYGVSA